MKLVKPHPWPLEPIFDQVLLKLGERMEVREVDFARMMQLVEECSKEGTREGEEEPDDAQGGVFGLGLLTVKRGIMPGLGKFPLLQWQYFKSNVIQFEIWRVETLYIFRNSVVWCGWHCRKLQKSWRSLEGQQLLDKDFANWKKHQYFFPISIFSRLTDVVVLTTIARSKWRLSARATAFKTSGILLKFANFTNSIYLLSGKQN